MKSKIYTTAMLLAILLAVSGLSAQPIVGYSGLFNFDTRISTVTGIISEAGSGSPVAGASIVLTGASQTFTDISVTSGAYSIPGVPTGNYNMAVMKPGYQSYNQNVFISGDPTQVINVSLIPGGSNSVEINSMLYAYANNIVENPSNVFTLSGDVHINNVLNFDGTVTVDKRPSLANPVVKGSCGIYTTNIGDHPVYWIKQNNIHFQYYTSESSLIPLSLAYILDGTFNIGGFNVTIGELIIDPASDFVEVKSIAKMPFPIDKVIDHLKEEYIDNIPFFVEEMSGSRILSKTNGVQTAVDINDISVNIGIVSLEDVHLYFNTNTQTYGGGFKLNIPGSTTANRSEPDSIININELTALQVELRDDEGHVVDSLSFDEFYELYRSGGFTLASFGAEIEFVQGSINKIIISIGTKIPLGPTGLFITEITGGLEDLVTKQWKVIANVDIELGFEVPILGSPVKLNDFGVKIQPWETFRGSGEFLVFDQSVSDGYIDFNKPLKQLSAECNLSLMGILSGRTYMGLVGGRVSGSGLMTIQTPSDLPWFLNWAQNKRIGSAQAGLSNQYFESEVKLGWINLGQRLEFGKQGFPWFHYYLGRNLNSLHQIWKGQKDGKQVISFMVPENAGQMLVVAMDTINPGLFDFSLQNPSGQIFDLNNAHHYEANSENQQTLISLLKPMEGEWLFLTAYEGDIALHISQLDQEPTVLSSQPLERRTRSNDISLSFTDYADTLQVQVFYNTNQRHFNGTLIDEFNIVNNGNLEFIWQNQDVPNGEYFIYCRIDDGYNPPVYQYAPGSVWVENEPGIEIPQNFIVLQEDTTFLAKWNAPVSDDIIATIVYYKNISTGRIDDETVYDSLSLNIANLKPGQEYQLWASFINENGSYSQASNIVNKIFTSPNRNNPPYFTLDPEVAFVFIEGEASQYLLTANDADGNLLTFNLPNDTLGITLNNDLLQWTPTEGQRGVYDLMITVSDGSEIDTTWQQLVVYTQDQVSVDIAFSSVNLYENDNMFVKIRNYFCEDFNQQVTLRNTRTQELATVETRRVNDFEYIGQFSLSFITRSEISVANGDTIEAKYVYQDQEYYAYAYYDTSPQPTDATPPGIISDLTAERLENNRVKLKWTATGNDGETGKAYRYDIRYAFEPIESESVYFTAELIQNFPYPSVSGQQDSIIVNLADLVEVTDHDYIYFSVKAEDEMQNRSALGNSAGVNCLLNPVNISATLENVYEVILDWDGPVASDRNETGFQYYNVFRKINDGDFVHVISDVGGTTYTDNVKNFPDGNYTYGIQAVYETGNSDTVQSPGQNLQRFVNVNMLFTLQGRTNYAGIDVEITGLDTVYTHQFIRTTNPTGLIMLATVYKSTYAIEATKEGYHTLYDTIAVSNTQKSFAFELRRIIPELAFLQDLAVPFEHDTCFEATQTITVSNTTIESGAYTSFIAGNNILFQEGTVVQPGGNLHAWITTDSTYCIHPETILAPEGDLLLEPAFTKEAETPTFFNVYPNPTTNAFTLELLAYDESSIISIEIYNMLGSRILSTELPAQPQYNFSLSGQQQGIYLVRVTKGNEVGIMKLIKQ
jgi:hypothetical protein